MTLAQRVARRTFRERIFLGLEAPAQAAFGFAGIVAFLTTLFGVLFSDTVHVRAASALRPPRARSAVATALALSLLLIAPTALSFISAVGTHLLVPPSD